ncbi:transposase, partial [Streptomyces sp. NPDC057910]|uniref:transposase n=1 Tax=Streptomyces sp. NPDC057910 TaxID=3346278 RepID=UPI0036EF6AD9
TVQVPRDRLGTFTSGLLPKYARRTGGLEEMVPSPTAKGLTRGEIVAHLAGTYGGDLRHGDLQADGLHHHGQS